MSQHLDQLEESIREAQKRALEQAEMDSLGTSLGDDGAGPSDKKRRRNLDLSSDYIDVGDDNSTGNLEDDLQYSSEEEDDDWDEVDDTTGEAAAGSFSVTVDPSLTDGAVMPHVISYYGADEMQEVQEGPVFSVQTGPDGVVYAEQADGGVSVYQHEYEYPMPVGVAVGDYGGTMGGDEGGEEVDENYDPTDFLQGLGQQRSELQDDLAVSDSDEEHEPEQQQGPGGTEQDDMMAF